MTPGPLSRARAPSLLRPIPTGAAVWEGARGWLVAAALGLQALSAQAQPGTTEAPTGAVAPAAAKAAASKPLWASLSAEQQAALQPLAPHWNGISEPHKRKWLALSRNYGSMKPEDQATLHSRMSEWASLSAQQRALARLNFAEVKRVPVEERKAKWEAYQALSEEEKRKFAESAPARPPSAAALPVRPVPARKLAPVPSTELWAKGEHMPRIQLAPPVPAPAPAPAMPSVVAPVMAPPAATPSPPAPPEATSAPVPAEAQVPAPITVPSLRPTEQPQTSSAS